MPKLVELEFHGALGEGYQVKLTVSPEGERATVEQSGSLPKATELSLKLAHWRKEYARITTPSRIIQDVNIYLEDISPFGLCRELAKDLKVTFHAWLASPTFRSIDTRLREALNPDEVIRILIRAKDKELHRLPWQTWEILESYPYAEIAMGSPEFNIQENFIRTEAQTLEEIGKNVRILAVLGDATGIDVDKDSEELKALPGAEVEFLVTPSREALTEQLWSQRWDIIYFAGHSRTDGDSGRIYISSQEYLSIEDVRNGLKRSIARGLQLAIFNSCDGLGLAWELEKLQIPLIIVMREPVPDRVAQKFVKYFLKAYSGGEQLFLAERYARERLESEESKFPCATWLPVICQNPVKVPPRWFDLSSQEEKGIHRERSIIESIERLNAENPKNSKWKKVGLGLTTSLACTSLVMGIRALGFLEKWELIAYDHLMRIRPAEQSDSRILVVELTDGDLNEYGYPIEDSVLAKTIAKVEEFKPRAIGVYLLRYQPRGTGRENLINLFNENKNIFTICSFASENKTFSAPPDEFSEDQKNFQVGFGDMPIDGELEKNEKIRRQLLTYQPRLASSTTPCITPFSFAFLLAYRFLDEEGINPIEVNSNENWQFDNQEIKKLGNRFVAYQDLGIESQIMINYRNSYLAQSISLQDVMEGKLSLDLVKDRIILIGATFPNSGEIVNTPIGKTTSIWVQAHMISQILSNVQDDRPLIWSLPYYKSLQWCDILFALGWSILGTLSVLFARKMNSKIFIFITYLGFIYVLSFVFIIVGGWVPLVPSLLSFIFSCLFTLRLNNKTKFVGRNYDEKFL